MIFLKVEKDQLSGNNQALGKVTRSSVSAKSQEELIGGRFGVTRARSKSAQAMQAHKRRHQRQGNTSCDPSV